MSVEYIEIYLGFLHIYLEYILGHFFMETVQ